MRISYIFNINRRTIRKLMSPCKYRPLHKWEIDGTPVDGVSIFLNFSLQNQYRENAYAPHHLLLKKVVIFFFCFLDDLVIRGRLNFTSNYCEKLLEQIVNILILISSLEQGKRNKINFLNRFVKLLVC